MHERYWEQLPTDLRNGPLPVRESTWWPWRDMEVHVERVGDPSAPVRAVLLHGAGGHAGAMWPFAALAAQYGMHVVVPDMPGYGRTRLPRKATVDYADWVALACELVETEKRAGQQLLVVGASLGGMLAYEAATRTAAADRVVVTCLPDPRDPLVRRHLARTRWMGSSARKLLRVLAGPAASLRVPIRWLVNMHAMSNTPELVDVVVGDEFGGGNRVPLGFLRSYLDSEPAMEPEDVTGPEFVLAHPGADRWTPVELSLRFFNRIAAAKQLVLLDNAGHFPVESPGVHQLVEVIRSCARA